MILKHPAFDSRRRLTYLSSHPRYLLCLWVCTSSGALSVRGVTSWRRRKILNKHSTPRRNTDTHRRYNNNGLNIESNERNNMVLLPQVCNDNINTDSFQFFMYINLRQYCTVTSEDLWMKNLKVFVFSLTMLTRGKDTEMYLILRYVTIIMIVTS